MSILVSVSCNYSDPQHAPGDDEWGYEDAGERWLPVHTVETVVSNADRFVKATHVQLISVISLLSADVPDLNSPANVDAAKEVREDYPCKFPYNLETDQTDTQRTRRRSRGSREDLRKMRGTSM